MSSDNECRKTFIVSQVKSRTNSIQFGRLPRNRKDNGSIKKDVEVKTIVRPFIAVITIKHEMLAQLLLESRIKLIAFTRRQWQVDVITKHTICYPSGARSTGKNQVFVVRRFKNSSISPAQDGVCPLYEIRHTKSRLQQVAETP